MVTMYDSASPQFIPAGAEAVAGYIDGKYKWASAYWTRFAAARKFRISLEGNVLADIFDVEGGTLDIAGVARVAAIRASAYLSSVVYCSLDNWEANKAVIGDLPVAWWIADYINGHTPTAPMEGACGWQYASLSPRYDLSVVDTDQWPNYKGLG